MSYIPRKKSPRAPSIALDESIERALRAYERERLHPAPTDVVAQNLGYKGASSGSALSAMASLRYYGLLERPKEGLLAVTKELEAFKFAPTEELRRSFLLGFLRRPALFAELLDKYSTGLPSDANLKYDLIQRGFAPGTAGGVVAVFRRSVEFAGFFNGEDHNAAPEMVDANDEWAPAAVTPIAEDPDAAPRHVVAERASSQVVTASFPGEAAHDRIPVRLPGKRVAWLVIPEPFYSADKERLKAQIDLLLTEDEQDAAS